MLSMSERKNIVITYAYGQFYKEAIITQVARNSSINAEHIIQF